MTFETYWRKLVAANPALGKNGRISLSRDSFKKQLAKAFDAASGPAATSKAARDFANVGTPTNPLGGIFGDWGGFGRKQP